MKSLKLNQLDSKQLNNIKGGATFIWSYKFNDKGERVGLKCQCSCKYANMGGSSTYDNFTANDAHNLTSEPQR